MKTKSRLRVIKESICITSFLALVASFIVIKFLPVLGAKPINYIVCYILLGIGILLTIFLFYLSDSMYAKITFFYITTPLTIIYISLLIYSSGGMESQLFLLYILPVIFAAVYQHLTGALYSMLIIALCYFSIFFITKTPENAANYQEIFLYHLRIFILVAFFCGYLAKRERDHKEKVKGILKSVMRTSTGVLDIKSFYPYGHAEEVMKLALMIADELKLSAKDREQLRLVALFHDVGIGEIRKEILGKKEKLTYEELQELREHPKKLTELFDKIDGAREIISAIYHCHERWDGEGYPDKLKGEEIPLLSRIINLSESYSAMIKDRPYRGAKTEEETIEEIKQLSGKQFDPMVVEAFLKIYDKMKH